MNKQEIVQQTEEFMKNAFIQNPHYSFNHWSVLYNHCVNVKNIALEINKEVKADDFVIAICALLHDIWKTYKAPPEVLNKEHESFNLLIAKDFLKQFDIPQETLQQIYDIISYNSQSTEMKVMRDADTLAMYKDEVYHMLYIHRAVENNLVSDIKRKINKFSRLNFDISKKIWEPYFKFFLENWKPFLDKISLVIS